MGGPLESLPRCALVEEPLMVDPYPFVKNVRNDIEKRSNIRIPMAEALNAYSKLEIIAPKQIPKSINSQ